mmetsp:Transcript_130727/g.419288  ORF Transcript_130727/g.419288 Transcript_130727/m.419288 type:complete len:245 (+) Transcript_130727:1790-2524(+)
MADRLQERLHLVLCGQQCGRRPLRRGPASREHRVRPAGRHRRPRARAAHDGLEGLHGLRRRQEREELGGLREDEARESGGEEIWCCRVDVLGRRPRVLRKVQVRLRRRRRVHAERAAVDLGALGPGRRARGAARRPQAAAPHDPRRGLRQGGLRSVALREAHYLAPHLVDYAGCAVPHASIIGCVSVAGVLPGACPQPQKLRRVAAHSGPAVAQRPGPGDIHRRGWPGRRQRLLVTEHIRGGGN